MKYISKTSYLDYLVCPKNAWLKLHRPDLAGMFDLSDFDKSLTIKGNIVELWARELFPQGHLLSEFAEPALEETKRLISINESVIFQPAFLKDDFLVRNDILEYDKKNGGWNLYEIKAINSWEENDQEIDYIEDLSFQSIVLQDSDIKINHSFLIYLNKDYIRAGEVNVHDLFIIEDLSSQILARELSTRKKMRQASKELLQGDEQMLECQCLYLPRSKHCATFNYSHPDVPQYSVHDLSRIGSSKTKLIELIDSGIIDINDIPAHFKLSNIQRNQVDVYQSKMPIINRSAIKNDLDSLTYPLYFFDYESYPAAIPLFKGFRPYQQIPFQFSLDILDKVDGDLRHHEYLHLTADDPSVDITKALKKWILNDGSIIVWHKSFEQSRNLELAERLPNEASFLNGLNERIYDLKDIFQKQFYVDERFKGSVSIKKVISVLVPSLSYQDLEIKEGGTAMEEWYEKIFKAKSDKDKIVVATQLLKYCALDTYAMYAIWRVLRDLDG